MKQCIAYDPDQLTDLRVEFLHEGHDIYPPESWQLRLRRGLSVISPSHKPSKPQSLKKKKKILHLFFKSWSLNRQLPLAVLKKEE